MATIFKKVLTINKLVVLAFTFEELNSMALAQGLIYRLRCTEAQEGVRYAVTVPPGFRSLGFAADLVFEYPPQFMRYKDYKEVSELTDKTWTKARKITSDARRRIGKKSLPYLQHNKLTQFLSSAMASSPRSWRYYWSNLRLQLWMYRKLREFSNPNYEVEFWPVNDWLCLSEEGLKYRNISLQESFQHRFEVLGNAISTGLTFVPKLSDFSSIPENFRAPDALVRSRNFAYKAQVHNSDFEKLRDLVLSLLRSGKSVVHCGSPILPLGIRHDDYLEVSDISLDEEMSLLAGGGACGLRERLAYSH